MKTKSHWRTKRSYVMPLLIGGMLLAFFAFPATGVGAESSSVPVTWIDGIPYLYPDDLMRVEGLAGEKFSLSEQEQYVFTFIRRFSIQAEYWRDRVTVDGAPIHHRMEGGSLLIDARPIATRLGTEAGKDAMRIPGVQEAFASRIQISWHTAEMPDAPTITETQQILWGIYLSWSELGLLQNEDLPLRVTFDDDLSWSGLPASVGGVVPWGSRIAYVARRNVTNESILRHELFHTVWATPSAPRWLVEGLAEFFAQEKENDKDLARPSLFREPPAWSWNTRDRSSILYQSSTAAVFSMARAMGRDRFLAEVIRLAKGETSPAALIQLAREAPALPLQDSGGIHLSVFLQTTSP